MNVDQSQTVTKEQLIADFKVVLADAEALLRATAGQSGEAITNLRAKAEESIAAAKVKIADVQEVLLEKSKVAVQATDDYVHEKPWHAVGIAAGIGLVIGLLVGRR